jgi:acyl-CoA synthetase (NDP forming)
VQRLAPVLSPKSIAIVGASETSRWSRYTYSNLQQGDYPHPVYLVNPRGGTVHGQTVFTSLRDVQEPVDLAYVLVGAQHVLEVLADAHEAGITNLVIVAAGYAETGLEGRAYQDELVAQADKNGQTILGPNNLGFVNAWSNVYAYSSAIPCPFQKGGVSVLSQSGALGVMLLDYCATRDIGIGHLVSLGNEAQVTVDEGIRCLIDDPHTRVLALYLESIRQPQRFLDACVAAGEAGKPVVIYKTGRGELGARVAAAHTGGLVGDDELVSAICEQYGIIRVDSLEEWLTTAAVFDGYGPISGHRVGYVSSSGAMCGVFSDAADIAGLAIPELDPSTVVRLQQVLPDFATAQNPLDTTGYVVNDRTIIPRTQQIVSEDPNLDFLVVNSTYPRDAEMAEYFSGLSIEDLCRNSPVPVVPMGAFPSEQTPYSRQYRRERGLPFALESVSLGLPAIAHTLWWSERQAQMREAAARCESKSGAVAVLPEGRRIGMWSEYRSSELLRAAGIPVVPSLLCADPEAAVQAAEALEYPVAIKVVTADISHKSDVGGVRLNVATADEVREATETVIRSTTQVASETAIDGVLVSPMRPYGTELLVGVIRDAIWGPAMAVGLGGIWVEVVHDVALRLLPVDHAEALLMLESLRGIELLRGVRNHQAADLDAVAEIISQISDLVIDLGPELAELEINPLLVNGSRVEALDALVRWTGV